MNRINFFLMQAEDGIRRRNVTGVQTCALRISGVSRKPTRASTLESASARPPASTSTSPPGSQSNHRRSVPRLRRPDRKSVVEGKSVAHVCDTIWEEYVFGEVDRQSEWLTGPLG